MARDAGRGTGRGRAPFFSGAAAAFALLAGAAAPTVAAPPERAGPDDGPPAEVRTVPEARERLAWLKAEAGRVDDWVARTWEGEFAKRVPALAAPLGKGESEAAHRERQMKARMAVSDLKAALREERLAWVRAETEGLLARGIPGELAVRLGPYDRDRGEYPLLLGFGWPAGLIARVRVPEREKEPFQIRFPPSLPAVYRINVKGEPFIESVDGDRIGAAVNVFVAPPGPRLLWRGAHESWITAVAFQPGGTRAVSGGGDGALCAWDVDTGNRIFRLEDVEMALSVAFSPDGASFATAGADSFVRLREAETGREIWKSRAAGMVFSVSFSPDGRHVAAGDDSGFLRILGAEDGSEILRGDLGSPVRAVSYSSEGRTIAGGTEGGAVFLWDTAVGRPAWRADVDGTVLAVAAGKGGVVAAGGGGNQLKAFRGADGTEAWSRKTDGEIRAVSFDAAGRLLASGGAGYQARVFLAPTGEPLWSAGIGSPIRAVAFNGEGTKLLVGSADFSVRLFEVEEGDRVLAAFTPLGRVYVTRDRAPRLFR